MKIGIKYCGGCNSRYDRTKEVEKLKKQFPQHEFTYQVDTGHLRYLPSRLRLHDGLRVAGGTGGETLRAALHTGPVYSAGGGS